jgi:predicted GNAT family acetyltransferase
MVAAVLRSGLGRRSNRAWWVHGPGGETAGAIVLERLAAGIWCGHLVLDDPSPAEEVGAFFQRAHVRTVWAPATALDPVLPHLPRAGRPLRQWLSAVRVPPAEARALLAGWDIDPQPGATLMRQATAADLEELTTLYTDYELNGGYRVGWIRQWLGKRVADDAVAVATIDGRIAAASEIYPRSRQYAVMSSITVPPEFRGRGLSGALVAWHGLREAEVGRGTCGKRAESNGMRPQFEPGGGVTETVFVSANLALTLRDRVLRRLLAFRGRRGGQRSTPRARTRSRYSKVPDNEPARGAEIGGDQRPTA